MARCVPGPPSAERGDPTWLDIAFLEARHRRVAAWSRKHRRDELLRQHIGPGRATEPSCRDDETLPVIPVVRSR